MDEPEDIASLLINLNGLSDLFNGEDMFGDDWLTKQDVQSFGLTGEASRGDSGSIHEQDQSTGPPPKDPPPRKRGRPKGSLNTTISNVSSKELQDELESKMAALELLQQENQLLNQHMSMLELVVQARDEQLHRLQLIQAGHADAALASLKTTVKEMGEMSLREMAQRCKDLMSQVGGLLLHGELKGDRRPLDAHMTSLQEAIKFCTLLRPDGLLLSGRDVTEMCASVEDASLAPQGHWQVVVSQMQLSAEQCRQAWVLSELYNRWHARLLADRTAITAALSQLLAVPRYGPVYNSAHMAGVTDAILLEKLHSSLVRERCLIALVGDVFRARILHDTQLAQQVVHSYPYCPDDIAILTTAAARHAPPSPPVPLALFPTLPTASLLPPAVPDLRDIEPPLPLARASTNESRSSNNNLSNPNSSTNLNSLSFNL